MTETLEASCQTTATRTALLCCGEECTPPSSPHRASADQKERETSGRRTTTDSYSHRLQQWRWCPHLSPAAAKDRLERSLALALSLSLNRHSFLSSLLIFSLFLPYSFSQHRRRGVHSATHRSAALTGAHHPSCITTTTLPLHSHSCTYCRARTYLFSTSLFFLFLSVFFCEC